MRADNMKRLEWIDIAKGIGIIFVILGHHEIEILVRIAYTFIFFN